MKYLGSFYYLLLASFFGVSMSFSVSVRAQGDHASLSPKTISPVNKLERSGIGLPPASVGIHTSHDSSGSLVLSGATYVITGKTNDCAGTTSTLYDSLSGGIWTISDTMVAKIDSVTGVLLGVAQGTAIVTYTNGTYNATALITIYVPPGPIVGNIPVCNVGSTISLTDTAIGGTWEGGAPGTATIDPVTGIVVSGIIAGNASITYTTGCGSDAYATITVNPPSAPIAGNIPMCVGGASITLSDTSGGGMWTGGEWTGGIGDLVTVDFATGMVTPGTLTGTATITYTSACGTEVFTTITVNGTPGSITGNAPLCLGGSPIVLGNLTEGGYWSGGGAGIATIDSFTGELTPDSLSGIVTVTYSNGCGPGATAIVTVSTLPYVSVIISAPGVCQDASILLTDSTEGGTWNTSNPLMAVVDPTTGIASGINSGADTISYSVTNACGTTTVTQSIFVYPLPVVGPISGGSPGVCLGTVGTLTDAYIGGTWVFNSPSVASVDPVTGVVNPIVVGSGIVTYSITNSCGTVSNTSVLSIDSLPVIGAISGDSTVCAGSVILPYVAVSGGNWKSQDTSIASIDSVSGLLTGISAGTVIISYYINSNCGIALATKIVTVYPLPNPGFVTGTGSFCQGSAISLIDTTEGGIWSSSNTSIATIDPSSGIIVGVGAGPVTFSYSVSNIWCGTLSAVHTLTVNPLPNAGVISGSSVVCLGVPVTFSDTSAGGVWYCSNTALLSLASGTGIASGTMTGTDTVYYSVTNGCGTNSTSLPVSVSTLPVAGSISGATSLCVGADIFLSATISGGSWSDYNGNTDVYGGAVFGLAAGSDSIYYAVTNSCGTTTTSMPVTVNPLPDPGTISGATSVCVGESVTLTTDGSSTGSWSSLFGYTAVSSGVVFGVVGGLDSIQYSVTNGCGTLTSSFAVNVNPLAVAGIIYMSSPTSSICIGAADTLTESSPGGEWSISNANAAVSTGGILIGVTAGTDTLTYTVTTVCGSQFTTKVITVNPLTNIGPIIASDSFCLGSTHVLADSVTGGIWISGNVAAATIDSFSGSLHCLATGIDTIYYKTNSVCGAAIVSKAITVLTLPDPGTIAGQDTVCLLQSITLSDAVTGGVWTDTSSTIASVAGGVVTGLISGNDLVSYTVVNMCGSTSATQMVFVKPLPDAGVITGAAAICAGSSATLSEDVAGGMWSVSNASASVVGSVVSAVSAGIDTVIYSVTNECGTSLATFPIEIDSALTPQISGKTVVCAGGLSNQDTLSGTPSGGVWSSSLSLDTISSSGIVYGNQPGIDTIKYIVANSCGAFVGKLNLLVAALPGTGMIGGTSFSVCQGSSIKLFDTVSGGVWTAQNLNATISGSADTISILGDSVGADIISYTVTNSCGTLSATVAVTVDSLPHPVITTATDSFTLTTSSGYATYQWYRNNTLIAGATGQVYVPVDTGSFHVVVTNSSGCSAASAVWYVAKLAVSDPAFSLDDVRIYPNPAKSELFVVAGQPVDCQLTTVDGRVITIARNAQRIDLNGLAGGIYFINVFDPGTNSKITTRKIIKSGN